jgi:hypothetical protein
MNYFAILRKQDVHITAVGRPRKNLGNMRRWEDNINIAKPWCGWQDNIKMNLEEIG